MNTTELRIAGVPVASLQRPDDSPQARTAEAVARVVETHQPMVGLDEGSLMQILQTNSTQQGRIQSLEEQLQKALLDLDECRNGPFSALGAVASLPEWAELDQAQRITVNDFLSRFPVQLGPGEATLIATYVSPTFDSTKDLIRMLGQQRVLSAMSPEARTKLQRDDPEQFADYFGADR